MGPASPLLAAGGPTLVSRGTRKDRGRGNQTLAAAFLKGRFSGRPASAHLLATKQWRTARAGLSEDSKPPLPSCAQAFLVRLARARPAAHLVAGVFLEDEAATTQRPAPTQSHGRADRSAGAQTPLRAGPRFAVATDAQMLVAWPRQAECAALALWEKPLGRQQGAQRA